MLVALGIFDGRVFSRNGDCGRMTGWKTNNNDLIDGGAMGTTHIVFHNPLPRCLSGRFYIYGPDRYSGKPLITLVASRPRFNSGQVHKRAMRRVTRASELSEEVGLSRNRQTEAWDSRINSVRHNRESVNSPLLNRQVKVDMRSNFLVLVALTILWMLIPVFD